jgi:aldose 1-epimerase
MADSPHPKPLPANGAREHFNCLHPEPLTTTRGTITLVAGDAQIELAPAVGGSLAAFTFRGTDVLRPTSANVRSERNVRGYACYPLVPYSNRIANARLTFDGREHALERNFGDHPHSIHGVGWQREWQVCAVNGDSALLMLEYAPEGRRGAEIEAGVLPWPWAFRATQSFALAAGASGATLTTKLTLTNAGETPFPFGLGWHPFFPRTATTLLGFVADGVWETDATQLPTRRVSIPADWCFDPPRALAANTIDNVFTGWNGKATLRDTERGIAVTVEADRACGFLVVYTPAGRDFLAIEPVTHMTDGFNRAAHGERETGTRTLAADAAFSATMRLSVSALP